MYLFLSSLFVILVLYAHKCVCVFERERERVLITNDKSHCNHCKLTDKHADNKNKDNMEHMNIEDKKS